MLDVNAEYAVHVTTQNGQELRTCPGRVTLKRSSAVLYPNPLSFGESANLVVDVEDVDLTGSEIQLYNMSGYFVKSIPASETTTSFQVPSVGNYVVKFISPSGYHREFKLIVK